MDKLAKYTNVECQTKLETLHKDEITYTETMFIDWECPSWLTKWFEDPFLYHDQEDQAWKEKNQHDKAQMDQTKKN